MYFSFCIFFFFLSALGPFFEGLYFRFCFNAKLEVYRGADKSVALPGRKQARELVRDARDFNNMRRELSSIPTPQGKAPKEIHAIMTETLACLLPGRAKDLSAPL